MLYSRKYLLIGGVKMCKTEQLNKLFEEWKKEQKKEELQKTLNTRNRLYYKRQKLDNESEKDAITKDIISVTSIIEKVRKEIKLCDEVGDNARKMKEQIKEMKEREKGKVKKKEEKKIKDKKKYKNR